jgi:hypothetical protein
MKRMKKPPPRPQVRLVDAEIMEALTGSLAVPVSIVSLATGPDFGAAPAARDRRSQIRITKFRLAAMSSGGQVGPTQGDAMRTPASDRRDRNR